MSSSAPPRSVFATSAVIVQAYPRATCRAATESDDPRDLLVLPQARLARVRGARRPDRPDAPPGRRAPEVDQRRGVPPRAELLPPAAGAGGAAARHLHRVSEGRVRRRRARG